MSVQKSVELDRIGPDIEQAVSAALDRAVVWLAHTRISAARPRRPHRPLRIAGRLMEISSAELWMHTMTDWTARNTAIRITRSRGAIGVIAARIPL